MHVSTSSFLFDTNALVYWVNPSSPMHEEVSSLVFRAVSENCAIFAVTSSLDDVYYALHSHYTDEANARASVREIAEVFDLVDLTDLLVFDALDSNEPDYEDGIIRAAAEALQVKAIISYDKKAFRGSSIPRLSASQAMLLEDA